MIASIIEFGEIVINVLAAVVHGELTQADADELIRVFWTHGKEHEHGLDL